MFSIDHIGVAVKSLAAAKGIYEKLGLKLAPEETVEAEQVRVVMVPLGESRIELLEPTSPDSVIAKFIAKRGEGIAPRLAARAQPGGRSRAPEERWRAPCFRSNQGRRRRTSLRFCASLERRWSAARTGRVRQLILTVWSRATRSRLLTLVQRARAPALHIPTCFFSLLTLRANTAPSPWRVAGRATPALCSK